MDFRTGFTSDKLPLVTVCMSSYNYAKYIEAALNSLLAQTYPFIELIIIDDCSSDHSVSIINKWVLRNTVKCNFIVHKKNKGITRTLNGMVRLSSGKYVVLFASDDIMLPACIENQVKVLESCGEEYGMCYSIAATMDEENNFTGYYNEGQPHYEGDVLEYFVHGWLGFVTPATMVKRSVYSITGLYDERLLIEDYDFWLRLFTYFKAKFCDYPGIIYRRKKESAVFDEWWKNNNERYYNDRIYSNAGALTFIKGQKKLKKHLSNKINQYLKALEANRSPYVPRLLIYLIKRGYFRIPLKVLFSGFLRQRRKSLNS